MFKSPGFQKLWLGLLLFTFLVMVIGLTAATGTAAEKVGPEIDNKTPDFTLNNLSADKVELYQVIQANKVTLINFWGMWCPYCVAEIPDLVKFYNRYHNRQVEIIGVNDGDNPFDLPAFVKKNQMNFPVLIDTNNKISNLYQVEGFPTTFIIDQKGKIKDIIVGATNQAALAAKVEMVLKEK